MLTYAETIDMMAERAFDRYMSGANDTRIAGVDVVAMIFNMDLANVEFDIQKELDARLKR